MKLYNGLSTAIYTQTTDLEHEINGIVTYHRKVEKMNLERVREINQAVIHGTTPATEQLDRQRLFI